MNSNKVWVSAVYNGAEGKPHGYLKGREYTIKVYQNAAGEIIVMPRSDIEQKLCYYVTIAAFLRDWQQINYLMDA